MNKLDFALPHGALTNEALLDACADALRGSGIKLDRPRLEQTWSPRILDLIENSTDTLQYLFKEKDVLFHEYVKELYEYILNLKEPVLMVLLTRVVASKKVIIRFDENPWFKDFVQEYQELVRLARVRT